MFGAIGAKLVQENRTLMKNNLDYYKIRRKNMNLTSKQRAYLGSKASTMNPIFQIGKASLTTEIISALDDALEKRELIKVSVLKNCADDPHEIAEVIAERTKSHVVKVIGKKMIFFRQAKKNSKYNLPD